MDNPQPLTSHLDELRRRILISLGAWALFSIASFFAVSPILTWLAKPVGEFVFTAPTEAFFIRLKIAFGVGAIAAFPFFIYEMWKFIELALSVEERSWTTAIVLTSSFLFVVGVLLSLFGVVPVAIKFLMRFSSPELRPMISLQSYLSFVLWMILGFGLFFQVPLVIVVLCRLGIADPVTLGRYRRHAILVIVILAALLTPGPDVFSLFLLALPSYLLFEFSLLIAHRYDKKRP